MPASFYSKYHITLLSCCHLEPPVLHVSCNATSSDLTQPNKNCIGCKQAIVFMLKELFYYHIIIKIIIAYLLNIFSTQKHSRVNTRHHKDIDINKEIKLALVKMFSVSAMRFHDEKTVAASHS